MISIYLLILTYKVLAKYLYIYSIHIFLKIHCKTHKKLNIYYTLHIYIFNCTFVNSIIMTSSSLFKSSKINFLSSNLL